MSGWSGLIGGFLLYVPMPYHTEAEGIIWLQEEALVRADANGFISEILAQPGMHVSRGDPLIRSVDPQLIAKLRTGEAQVAEWKANYAIELLKDRTKAEMARQKLVHEEAELAATRQRAADLTVRAQTGGTFVVPQALDLPGRFYHRGDLMALCDRVFAAAGAGGGAAGRDGPGAGWTRTGCACGWWITHGR